MTVRSSLSIAHLTAFLPGVTDQFMLMTSLSTAEAARVTKSASTFA
jgi:hypothetical protein